MEGIEAIFALIGAFALIFLVSLIGMFIWCWWAEKIINRPTRSLKELKKEWQLSAVEDR